MLPSCEDTERKQLRLTRAYASVENLPSINEEDAYPNTVSHHLPASLIMDNRQNTQWAQDEGYPFDNVGGSSAPDDRRSRQNTLFPQHQGSLLQPPSGSYGFPPIPNWPPGPGGASTSTSARWPLDTAGQDIGVLGPPSSYVEHGSHVSHTSHSTPEEASAVSTPGLSFYPLSPLEYEATSKDDIDLVQKKSHLRKLEAKSRQTLKDAETKLRKAIYDRSAQMPLTKQRVLDAATTLLLSDSLEIKSLKDQVTSLEDINRNLSQKNERLKAEAEEISKRMAELQNRAKRTEDAYETERQRLLKDWRPSPP